MITQVVRIDAETPQIEQIIKAAEVIKRGGLAAFPTETVYGLGADFSNEKALRRLRDVKKRPEDKPFTIHIADIENLSRFECEISLFGMELIERFWPGPLTLVFETKKSGPMGFRMPDNEIARELIRQSGTLLAAPSANMSGGPTPTNAQEVLDQLEGRIDLILDAGETAIGKESTVIDFTMLPYKLRREGAITKERIAEIEFHFWKDKMAPTIKKILFVCTGNSCRSVMAEGFLKKRLTQVERDDIEVFSRGVSAPAFLMPTPETFEVLKGIGIDMNGYRAVQLIEKDIREADLILVMEDAHRDEVINMAPSRKDKVHLLAEFGLWGGRVQEVPLEIDDPIGRPLQIYKETFTLIKGAIERLINVLI